MTERATLLLLLGAGALALLWYARTDEGAAAIESAGESVSDVVESAVQQVTSVVRGIRNNNPGNIRKDATAWQGLAAEQNDSAFFQFASMAYGIRAMIVILRTYKDRYGLDTVRKIINRWAPPNENDTGAYVNAVANYMNVLPDQPIDPHDEDTAFALVRGIIRQENGSIASTLVSDTNILAGIDLA